MDNIEKTYSISEVSKRFNLSDGTIRKYEKDYNINIPRNELGHRYYTEKEIAVFDHIINLKDQGANIHIINKMLDRSVDFKEQQETSLDLITMDKMTGLEVKQLLDSYLSDAIIEKERQIIEEYDIKLQEVKKEIQEEVILSMKEEFQKQNELLKKENEDLISKLNNFSIWDLFKRKNK